MGALSSTALKAIFVTGAIPTETDFANLFDSSPNIVDDNLLVGYETNLVPVSPPLLATATPVVKRYSYISGAPADLAAILLPVALSGAGGIICNSTLSTITVYCQSADDFNTYENVSPVLLPPHSVMYFICFDSGSWVISISDFILGSNVLTGYKDDITDVSPSDPDTAFQLVYKFNTLITTHETIGASKLPLALVGREVQLSNLGAYHSHVICQSGDTFINFTGSDTMPVEPGDNVSFVCMKDGKWSVFISKALDVFPSYERYESNISQTGTDAPTVDFVQTDMGNPTWSFISTGTYKIQLTDAFNGNTLISLIPNVPGSKIYADKLDESNIRIRTYNSLDVLANDLLVGTTFIVKNFIAL